MDSNDAEMQCPGESTKEEVNDAVNKDDPDEVWRHKPKSRIHEGEIIEGKREKKTVQRLDMQMGKPKEKAKIESIGKGDKLGDIARVNHAVGKLKAPLLKPLHKILYDRPGAVASLRKHIRLFNGFPFEVDSDHYNKKKEKMLRFPKGQLKNICQILDLERSGNQSVLVDRIMLFLINPTNSGKPVILKKKKKKNTKDAKREKKTASQSKKQQLESGKSKAIVTDSSSDEDEMESKKDAERSLASVSRKPKVVDGSSEEEIEEEEEEKKNEDSEDPHDSEDAVNKKTKGTQKKVTAKPAPKTKKADSSSTRKRTAAKHKERSDSSEDDEPLIKMIKKPPTNEQLTQTVKNLLKDANLEEVTMKQVCQQVYDLYPDFDLSNRKEFIKDTVKSLIS